MQKNYHVVSTTWCFEDEVGVCAPPLPIVVSIQLDIMWGLMLVHQGGPEFKSLMQEEPVKSEQAVRVVFFRLCENHTPPDRAESFSDAISGLYVLFSCVS